MLKVYAYKNCSTCQKALKHLKARGVAYQEIPIREQPPGLEELKRMLKIQGGRLASLFNTSGRDYQEMSLKDKLPGMAVEKALELLAGNGNLVKRPFALQGGVGAVGFKPEEWDRLFSR